MLNLNKVERKKILVIGDIMLDNYYIGSVHKISPEAPVPIFNKKEEKCTLGGAANVACNLSAAGQDVSIMSIIGNDSYGKILLENMNNNHINTRYIKILDSRKTTVKTRLLANNNQQIIRIDTEDKDELDGCEYNYFINLIRNDIEIFDLVLISDYLKGFLSHNFTKEIIKISNDHKIPVIVDVKDKIVDKYKNAFLIKPNLNELKYMTELPITSKEEIITASKYLMNIVDCKYVLTTCGSEGMILVSEDEEYFVDSIKQDVYDVTGAGDTTISYLGVCIANNMDLKESVNIANIAAAIQVSKVGTSKVYWNEIRDIIYQNKQNNEKYIKNVDLKNLRNTYINKKIVFTNGCFDIMHIGHIKYLKEASKLGDILIVGINSDDSIKRIKGKDRPINNEIDRLEMMSSLKFIDYVCIFNEDTPLNIIKEIKPDILVKGGDYSDKYIIGTKEVEEKGGKVILIPFIEGKSTTSIINKIKNS